MRPSFSSALLAGVATAALATAPSLAEAAGQSDAAGVTTTAEVVVTAARRSVNIQKVPDSIRAVSAVTLDQNFTNDVYALNGAVPSLEIAKASGVENQVTIRGIGSETPENSITSSPGVSIFIDGVYLPNDISLDQTLFDIDQIEILRGPQGDLYGESSIGGVINIKTKQPELGVFGGTADLSIGNYDLNRERAELNVPIGDDLAIRASAQQYSHDGFTQDVALNNFDEDDAHDNSEKFAVKWKPTNDFTAILSGELYNAYGHGASQKNITDPNSDPYKISQDYPGEFAMTTQLYSINLQQDFSWGSVKSVFGYSGLNQHDRQDVTRSTFAQLGSYEDLPLSGKTSDVFTEELDALSKPGTKLDWVAGVFAMNDKSTAPTVELSGSTDPTTAELQVPPNIFSPTNVAPGDVNYANLTTVTRHALAGFVRFTYHVTDNLRLTAGGRYNWDHYADHSYNVGTFGGANNSAINGYVDGVWTWHAAAEYDVTPTNMVYASVTRGYKPGGLNGNNGQYIIKNSYQDEQNTSFEVGSKNQFFDRRLTVNLDAYYYLYKNFQYLEDDPVPFDGGITNIPNVHAYGLEIESNYRSEDNRLVLEGSVGLEKSEVIGDYYSIDSTIEGEIENNPNGPCAGYVYYGGIHDPAAVTCYAAVVAAASNLKGHSLPDAPNVTGEFTASYKFETALGTLTPHAQYIYRGNEWARVFQERSLDYVKPYGLTNLGIEFDPTNSKVKVIFTATNVFNVAGINSKFTDPYGVQATSTQYVPPRQLIGTLAFAF